MTYGHSKATGPEGQSVADKRGWPASVESNMKWPASMESSVNWPVSVDSSMREDKRG